MTENEQKQPSANPTPQGTIPTPEQVATEVKKGNFNKSILLVIGLVILTAVLLVISFNVRRSSTPSSTTTKQVQTNFAHTNLSVSSDVRIASGSGAYVTDVNIDSGDNKVTGVELLLSYDPKVLGSVDIKAGTFLTSPVVLGKQIDTTKGTISYILGTAQGTHGVKGTGQVAVISFTKVGTGNTTIDFLPDTLVTAEGYNQSVLNQTSSAVIGSLPTPTFSPSAQTSPAAK